MKFSNRIPVYFSLAIALLLVGSTPAALADTPLAAYAGFGHDPQSDEERFEREEMAREMLIADCMEANEYYYEPFPSLPLEEFDSITEAVDALSDNPNERYARLLGDADRVLYYQALYGVDNPFAAEADLLHDPATDSGGGCFADAHRTIRGVFAAKSALQEPFDAMRRAVMADHRVAAAEAAWAGCMAQRGQTGYASPRSLEASLDERIAEETRRLAGKRGPLMPPQQLFDQLEAEYEAARQVGMDCAHVVDLPGVVAAVRSDYEAAFVNEHREVLEAHAVRLAEEARLLDDVLGASAERSRR